jgi:hypothetical protein
VGEVRAMGEFVRWLFVFAVLIVLSAVGGWAVSGAIQRSWRRLDQSDQHLPLLTHFAWDEPDIGPPSVSPEARAEVTDLEALWSLPPHRASSGTD